MTETVQLEVNGIRLAVQRRSGLSSGGQHSRGVLLLHGWPGTRHDWDSVLAGLAASSRWDSVSLICPDLRGYGESEAPGVDLQSNAPYADYGPAAHVADMAALIEALGLQEVVVGAYDLGANIAQSLARRPETQIRGLVLCDPVHAAARAQAGRVNLGQELWYQALHAQPWASDLIAHDRATVEVYLRHFYTHWWGQGHVDEGHFQDLVERYSRAGAFEASIGWYRSRAKGRVAEAAAAAGAAKITTPTEVLWGVLDPITPVVFSESLDQSFADANLTLLDGVGHFAPLEAPPSVVRAFDALAERLGW